MSNLLSLPNEILDLIICSLIPDLADESKWPEHELWRESPHIQDLRSLCLSCKHLSTIARPHFFATVVLNYPTCMIRFLRTLLEQPQSRGMVRTLSITCPLTFCDTIIDPFSPRETFLDDNPDLILNYKWNTSEMDEFAAELFRIAGLDGEEYKRFTDDELEELDDCRYWMCIDSFSERVGYENTLMQGLALMLIGLCKRTQRLCVDMHSEDGDFSHFEDVTKALGKSEILKNEILTELKVLEFRGELHPGIRSPRGDTIGYLDALFNIPSLEMLICESENVGSDVSTTRKFVKRKI